MEILKKIWAAWKAFGKFMGDVIGRIFLTLFYFTVYVPFGLGVRLFGDPLKIRPEGVPQWAGRKTEDLILSDCRRLA